MNVFHRHLIAGRNQSLSLGEFTDEVAREGRRLDRSSSWLMRKAWLLAREQIRQIEPAPPIELGEDRR